jgi:hypothetical protein
MTYTEIIRRLGLDPNHLDEEGAAALNEAIWTLRDADAIARMGLDAEDAQSIEDAIYWLGLFAEVA